MEFNKNKQKRLKICPHCGELLERISFTAQMTEEWSMNGDNWECTARHSLTQDPQMPVSCANCENVVGTGVDLGFTEQ